MFEICSGHTCNNQCTIMVSNIKLPCFYLAACICLVINSFFIPSFLQLFLNRPVSSSLLALLLLINCLSSSLFSLLHVPPSRFFLPLPIYAILVFLSFFLFQLRIKKLSDQITWVRKLPTLEIRIFLGCTEQYTIKKII